MPVAAHFLNKNLHINHFFPLFFFNKGMIGKFSDFFFKMQVVHEEDAVVSAGGN